MLHTEKILQETPTSAKFVPSPPSNSQGKPDEGQLEKVYKVLADTLPKLFIQPMDYSIYNPNVVFENNIRGTRSV